MEDNKATNNLRIGDNENLFLDDVILKNVTGYELKHSASEMAELTISLSVTVNQAVSEPEK